MEWKSNGMCRLERGFESGRDGMIEIQQGDIKIQRSKQKISEGGQEGIKG